MNKHPYPIQLILSAITISGTLLWLFFGQDLIYTLLPNNRPHQFYIFFSGAIFTLGIVGAYTFVNSILIFANFIQAAPSEADRLNELILEQHKDALFYKNKEGVYLFASAYAASILKVGHLDILHKTDQQLHDTLLAHKIEMEDKRVIENNEIVEWETSIELGNEIEYYLCRKTPSIDADGNVIGLNGYCKNITREKKLQKKIDEIERSYQQIFNVLPYPVVIIDMSNMKPFSFNEAICKLLKYNSHEFSQKSFSSHVVNDLQTQFKDTLIKTLKNGSQESELKLNSKNRDIIDVAGFFQRIEIDDKHYLHIMLRDITDTKRATTELIGSELKYRSLFEHASDAIIIVDIHSLHIIDANEISIQKLGYSRETLASMNLFDLDAMNYAAQSREQLKNLEIYNHVLYEHCICNRKGETIDVEVNAHKVNYGHEEVYQFVLRDIKQRKNIEKALRDSEHRYRQMFESNQAIKLVINPESNIIENANPAAAEFYGYSLDELKGMHLSKINVLPTDKLDILIQQTAEQNRGFYSCPHKLANGDIRFVEVRDGPIEINGHTSIYSIIHDVTAGKQAEDKLILASKMFDYSTDAAIISDENNCILSVNQAFTEITGYQQSEVQGKDPSFFLSDVDENLITDEIKNVISQKGHWQGEVWCRQHDGKTFPLAANIHIIKSTDDNIINHVLLLSPQISLDKNDDAAKNYSALTHLPNKTLYLDRLNYALERNQRNKKELAILIIDFRNFSQINQQFGYDIGDRILQSIAKRLKYCIRESDTIAHLDSDDFVLLLEDLVDVKQAGIVAQKIISTLSEDYRIDNYEISLEVSIGISISPDDGESTDTLMKKAQQALQQAQSQEGNVFQLSATQLNQNAHIWLQTDEQLLNALKHQEFNNVYQPIIDTDKNQIIGIETLLRWQHPEHGDLLPTDFIPNAEKSGFISAIGEKSIDTAFADYSQWINHFNHDTKLFLNISLPQLNEDLLKHLLTACQQYNINNHQVALDISEQHIIGCTSDNIKILQQIKQHDFYLCIDNYSVGTSLERLLQCPPSAIKIGHSFIQKSDHSPQADTVLNSLTLLAYKLGIDVIAEGIETDSQFNHLANTHVHLMQGYYFSTALPAHDMTNFINQHNGSSHETS